MNIGMIADNQLILTKNEKNNNIAYIISYINRV